MQSKAFTIKEMIVSIAALGILLIIYLAIPKLNHNRELPRSQVCSANLKGIGTAIALYANDHKGKYPVVGNIDRRDRTFGIGLYSDSSTRWAEPGFDDWDNQATVGGSLYLLIKHADLVPKVYICPMSEDTDMEFDEALELCDKNNWPGPEDWSDLNDFQSMRNLSYSYNDPWSFPLTDSSPGNMAVAADKSNAYNTDSGMRNIAAGDFPVANKDGSWDNYISRNPRHGNSPNHDSLTQNVLFVDSHVKNYKTPTVGIGQDNIYTYWSNGEGSSEQEKMVGRWDQGRAVKEEDSYLGN